MTRKFCRNCKHIRAGFVVERFGRGPAYAYSSACCARKSLGVDPVSGEEDFQLCSHAREGGSSCGPEGRNYEAAF